MDFILNPRRSKNHTTKGSAKQTILEIYNLNGDWLNITDLNYQGLGIKTFINYKPNYIIRPQIRIFSKTKQAIELFYELTYPDFIQDEISFAMESNDYNCLIKLIEKTIRDKNYKILSLILSEDLPRSIYVHAYKFFEADQKVREIVWNEMIKDF